MLCASAPRNRTTIGAVVNNTRLEKELTILLLLITLLTNSGLPLPQEIIPSSNRDQTKSSLRY